jgi:hypothetical protein
MRGLFAPIAATLLLVISTSGVVADPTAVGTEFTGRLAFGACEPDQPSVTGCGEPQVIEPFSDSRLEGSVAITGWWGGYEASSTVWFGSWLIGDSDDGWVEVASPRLQSTDGTATQYTSVLVGTGVNTGHVAYSEVTVTGDVFDFDGRIVREDIYPIMDYSGVVLPGDLAELDW